VSLDNLYSVNFGWKIDPDGRQDRTSSPVTTRMMTEEEMKKYGIAMREEDEEMKGQKSNIETESILEICRIFGTGKAACIEIAKTYSLSEKTAANMIYMRNVRKILAEEKLSQSNNYEIIKETTQENTSPVPPPVESISESSIDDGLEKNEFSSREDINRMIKNIASSIAGIKIIDFLQDKLSPEQFEGFCIGNAINCLSEYRFKGGLCVLKKAAQYVDRIIKIKETA
jgi:hypothetical protein